MTRVTMAGIGLVLGLTLLAAACGDDSDEESTAAGGGATDIAVRDGTAAGTVLVDAEGRTLYSPEQEANGTIVCVDECAAIWPPLAVTSGSPTAPDDLSGRVGTVQRPDGSMQVTFDGKPLYTFSQDEQAGDVKGDAVADEFAGTDFVWHAVTTGGSATPAPATTMGGGGYGY